MGFRIVSVIGIIVFVALLAYFIAAPQMSVSENPPGGDTNTPVESMAAPVQQETPPSQPAQPGIQP
jgi:hypothetical protein